MKVYKTMLSKILIVCFAFIVTASSGLAASASNNGVPGELTQIQALLTQILNAVTPAPPVAQNKTRLLFPFVTNQAGFDTGIAISNTGQDSTGTIGVSGTATIYFFGAGAPSPVTTPMIAPGGQYANTASALAPGFQGYVEVVCNFPFAHGWGFLSDVGARNLAATIPALVLPLQRTNTAVESAGQ